MKRIISVMMVIIAMSMFLLVITGQQMAAKKVVGNVAVVQTGVKR